MKDENVGLLARFQNLFAKRAPQDPEAEWKKNEVCESVCSVLSHGHSQHGPHEHRAFIPVSGNPPPCKPPFIACCLLNVG